MSFTCVLYFRIHTFIHSNIDHLVCLLLMKKNHLIYYIHLLNQVVILLIQLMPIVKAKKWNNKIIERFKTHLDITVFLCPTTYKNSPKNGAAPNLLALLGMSVNNYRRCLLITGGDK